MVRHEQAGDDLAVQDVPFHDLRDIGFGADPVPDSFGIDHDTGAQLAMVEAAGFIRADEPFEIQPLRFSLEMGVKPFRAQIGATAARVVFRALVRADEDMPLEWWHAIGQLDRHGDGIEAFHQERHIVAAQNGDWPCAPLKIAHDFLQPQ